MCTASSCAHSVYLHTLKPDVCSLSLGPSVCVGVQKGEPRDPNLSVGLFIRVHEHRCSQNLDFWLQTENKHDVRSKCEAARVFININFMLLHIFIFLLIESLNKRPSSHFHFNLRPHRTPAAIKAVLGLNQWAVKISRSYLGFVCFGMTLHILHGCERFESTDNPEQDQPQNIPGLLRVLNAS